MRQLSTFSFGVLLFHRKGCLGTAGLTLANLEGDTARSFSSTNLSITPTLYI